MRVLESIFRSCEADQIIKQVGETLDNKEHTKSRDK